MADPIRNLPPSQDQPSDIDVNVMREVFGDGQNVVKSIQLQKVIIPAILFVVLSLPFMDHLLKNIVPDSEMLLLFVKTLIFLIVLVVLQLVNM